MIQTTVKPVSFGVAWMVQVRPEDVKAGQAEAVAKSYLNSIHIQPTNPLICLITADRVLVATDIEKAEAEKALEQARNALPKIVQRLGKWIGLDLLQQSLQSHALKDYIINLATDCSNSRRGHQLYCYDATLFSRRLTRQV